MKQKKQSKLLVDIKPVLFSKKDRRIFINKQRKHKLVKVFRKPVFDSLRYQKKKVPFKQVIDLRQKKEFSHVQEEETKKVKLSDVSHERKISPQIVAKDFPMKAILKEKKGFIKPLQKTEKEVYKTTQVSLEQSRLQVSVLDQIQKKIFSQAKNLIFLISQTLLSTRLKKSFYFFILFSFFFMFSIRALAFFQKDMMETKNKILDETTVAYQYLLSGQNSVLEKDYDLALYKFNIAAERFLSAQKELNRIGQTVTYFLKIIPGGSVVSSGKNLLEAGGNIAYASKHLAQFLKPFSQAEDIFGEIKTSGQTKESQYGKISFTQALVSALQHLYQAKQRLDAAEKNLAKVQPSDFPKDVAPKVTKIKNDLPKLSKGLDYFISHADSLLEILGHNKPKKYLLLFENNRELRATGGFIGTYGLFDMKEGKIENLKVEGPYNIDGQLKEKFIAPEPLRLIQVRFFMRDANWFLDFPTSAKKIILLHEKAGGPTVDGVIVFTASVLEELLKIIGPVEMPDYGVTIDADNFFEETQREVEIEYDKELNKPKKFIADLLPKILDKTFSLDKEDWGKVVNIFSRKLSEKHILIYFADESLENLIFDFGWAGEVKSPNDDYLAVVSSNIGGGKTDHVIDQRIFHSSEIQADGSIIDTVEIIRTHNGSKEDFWTNVKNVSFLRIYTPLGSKLIEASGFDSQFYDVLLPLEEEMIEDPLIGKIEKERFIHNPSKVRVTREGTKTVFGSFVGIEVGETKKVRLKYQLPYKINLSTKNSLKRFSLFVQKQPGARPSSFESKLLYPHYFNLIWKYPENIVTSGNNTLSFKETLDTDKSFAVIFSETQK